ncbi:MAG: DUF4129 domain-containing protein [Planctomycetaceae bacterium]|nr:DUF4129 domain-containing protein [Planctomycetaceae bacterium]
MLAVRFHNRYSLRHLQTADSENSPSPAVFRRFNAVSGRRLRVFRRVLFGVLLLTAADRGIAARAFGNSTAPQSSPVSARGQMSGEQIREAARSVMQQHNYRSVRRRVLENLEVPAETSTQGGFLLRTLRSMGDAVSDFFDWLLSGLFSGRKNRPAPPAARPAPPKPASTGGLDFNLGNAMVAFALILLLVVTIWILAAVVKKTESSQRNTRGLFDTADTEHILVPPGEQAVSTYESRAVMFADAGNYRMAIRELLIGSMSWIERAGRIRFRRGLTNRDYIRSVWREENRREAFVTTAVEFERVFFGRRTATEEMFDRCLQAFRSSFREETETAAG